MFEILGVIMFERFGVIMFERFGLVFEVISLGIVWFIPE